MRLLSVTAFVSALVFASAAAAAPVPMPLISRGLPAFTSSGIYPARDANDGDYDTVWRGSSKSWLAYDLSTVPSSRRSRILVAWYNDPITTPYDYALAGDVAYNEPRDYTVQANAAHGGGAAPSSGWVTLATVTGNRYHSRQHLVDFAGYNWIRLNVSAVNGSPGNTDAAINLDVHDARFGATDSWMFYGDSITMDGLDHRADGSAGNFSQLIAASTTSWYPAFEDGGIGGLTSADGAAHISGWLGSFPGRFVALSYGTNDADRCTGAQRFYASYVAMVKAVLASGKIPVVPTIPWARSANVRTCGPALNARLGSLYAAYPHVIHGPDLWSFFQRNPGLISGDGLHPTAAGYAAYRRQWADAMHTAVYGGSVIKVLAATRRPRIVGRPTVGSSLRVRPAAWTRRPTRVGYQWVICRQGRCRALRGARAQTLRVQRSYVGQKIRVVATGVAGGATARSSSKLVAIRRG